MSQDEVTAIFKAKNSSERTSWEQTRMICFYTIVSQQGTKHIKTPKDLFPLYWDEGVEEVEQRQVAKVLTREEMLARAELISKK